MKKLILILGLIAVVKFNFGQATTYRNFDLDSKRAVTTLTDAEKKEPVVIVEEKKAVEMIEDKSGNLTGYLFYHRIAQINSEDKLQSFNKIYLPVSNPDALLALKARTVNKNGKTIELFKGDTKQINEDGENYLILALEGLEVGAEVEYYFLLEMNFQSFYTQRVEPKYFTRNYTFEFISPEKLIYESKSYNSLPDLQDTLINGKNILSVAIKNLEASEDERYAANDACVKRAELKLSYNLYTGSRSRILTFTDAAKRYYNNLHDISKDEKKAINKVYDKIKLSKVKGTDEKIRAVENYMKTNFNIVSGVDAPLSDAIKNNFLSKFQAIMIYIYIFEEEKIAYEIVSTTQRDKAEFDPSFESWNFLQETFFYFPDTKKYMTPDVMLYRYGMILPDCMDQKGLFIKTLMIGETKSALNSIKYIEPSNFDKNIDDIEAEISFPASMEAVNIKLTRTEDGYSAANIRPIYFYVNEEKKKEVVEEIMLLGIKDAVAKNIKVQNFDITTDDINKPFIAKADVEVASVLETAGENYLFKVGACIGPQAELYQEKERKYPGYMGYPHSLGRKLIINIPEGYEAKGLNELAMDVSLNDNGQKTAGFISTYTVSGNQIIITIDEFYKKQYYPVAQFNDLRKVINAAADFNKLTIVFSKKK